MLHYVNSEETNNEVEKSISAHVTFSTTFSRMWWFCIYLGTQGKILSFTQNAEVACVWMQFYVSTVHIVIFFLVMCETFKF